VVEGCSSVVGEKEKLVGDKNIKAEFNFSRQFRGIALSPILLKYRANVISRLKHTIEAKKWNEKIK
jgi:hypothetical protein